MKRIYEIIWECAVTVTCGLTVLICVISITREATFVYKLDSTEKRLEIAEQVILELQDKITLIEGKTDILWDVRR